MVDWDEDGKKDLIVGNEGNEIRVYLNSGTNAAPVFTTHTIVITNSNLFRCSPEVYDLNRDGKKDLIAGESGGYVYFYENIGTNASPSFQGLGERLKLDDGTDLKVSSGAHIDLMDWDGNGSMDLLIGDYDAYLTLFINPSGDAEDPEHPSNVVAYSDYTTPTIMALTWDDPTTLYGGTPISPSDFTIEIERDSVWVASLSGGVEQYNDTGLNDGQYYQYSLITKLVSNDSTSMPAIVYWHAGGSPFPAAPSNLSGIGTLTQADLSWSDPTTQEDGTLLDDLDSIFVYRNGIKLTSIAPGVQVYTDLPPAGFSYNYTVTAVDDETPPNESQPSNEARVFVGDTPKFLVWVGTGAAGASAASGDSIFQSLVDNGEGAFLTDDLFEFGNNLSIYDAIFVVLGIYSNNHVISATDPEGPALEAYIQNGGKLYLEGGDCFAYDPGIGGYNINPWFSCTPVGDGSADVFTLVGLNNLSAFQFIYNGENNFMDELSAISSIEIWRNSEYNDIHGLYNPSFGAGTAIGVVPSFGGMINSSEALNSTPRVAQNNSKTELQIPVVKRKIRVEQREPRPFTKRYGYIPENKAKRKALTELLEITAGGVRILANNKDDLMAAYLGLFGYSSAPVLYLSHTACYDTLAPGGTMEDTLTITNAGSSMASDLTFSITENPAQNWVSVSPTTDTLAAGESVDITIALDANGLSTGTYITHLMIACNDPAQPLDSVEVCLEVIDPTTIGEDGNGLPKTFALLQNYPNPFNPTTTIRYQLPRAADVKLEIYNSLGQRIRSLLDSRIEAGYHQVIWDGRDDFGLQVASGVYLYRIESEHFSKVRKMLLLK